MQRHHRAAIALAVAAGSCTPTPSRTPTETPPKVTPADAATVALAAAVPCATSEGAADVDLGGARAVRIAANGERACALLDDGGVMCWGNDSVEHGSVEPRRAAPERMPGFEGVVELALGPHATCARRTSGQVSCWGQYAPRLGALDRSPPGTSTTGSIAVGFGYGCAIQNRAVVCTGEMIPFGKLPRPAVRIAGISRPVAVSAGGGFACAIEAGGRIACWGSGYNPEPSELEDDNPRRTASVRGVRAGSISGATRLALSDKLGCAVHRGGEVVCWPDPETEQPFAIENLTGATRIAVDERDGCAVHASGAVSCWRGDSAAYNRAVPVPGLDDAIDIALGSGGLVCTLRSSGRVRCWGRNDARQLGVDTMLHSAAPVEVCGLDHVTQVAVGVQHACALRDTGELSCWGANHVGQLEGGTANATHLSGSTGSPPSAVPRRVAVPRPVAQVVAFHQTTCTVDRAGEVACWGGNPLAGGGVVAAAAFKLPTEPVTSISLGDLGLCAVTRAGSVTCNGSTVAGVDHATRVRVGSHACAEVVDAGERRLICWASPWLPLHALACRGPGCALDPTMLVVPLACDNWQCSRSRDGEIRCREPEARPIADRCTPWPPHRIDELFAPRTSWFSCSVRPDGLVACSGENTFGQLGTGRMGYPHSPAGE